MKENKEESDKVIFKSSRLSLKRIRSIKKRIAKKLYTYSKPFNNNDI